MKAMTWVLYYMLANGTFTAVPTQDEEACMRLKADMEMTMASAGNPVTAAICSFDEIMLLGEVEA